MAAMAVVKAFDVIKEHEAGDGVRGRNDGAETFRFQCGKEAFHHSVIEGISAPTHRRTSPGFLQSRLEIATGILRATIRMVEEAWSWWIALDGLAPGFQDQSGGEIGASGPAGDFA